HAGKAAWCSSSAARPELLDDADEAGVGRDARDAATFCHRLSAALLYVRGEGDRGGGADRHADAIGMDRAFGGLELADPLRVQASRDEDADVVEPGLVEPRADLLHEVDGDAAALAGRVESPPAQALAQRLGDA